MPNERNLKLVEALAEKLEKAKSIVFADFKGLKANDANNLRAKLSDNQAEVEIAKNTLIKIAMKKKGIDLANVEKNFEGQTVTILSYGDPIAALKSLFDFIKSVSLPKVKLGFFDGRFLASSDVEKLSKLPSRLELISQVLSGFNSPITGFVNVLSGTKRNFVYVLNAIKEKK